MGGFTNMLMVKDIQPFSGARMLFWCESHLIELPLVMLDNNIHSDRKVRDKYVLFQLKMTRR